VKANSPAEGRWASGRLAKLPRKHATIRRAIDAQPRACPRDERDPLGVDQPRRAALIAAMSIFFMPIIALKARFASSPPAANASVSTRGVICQETPHLSLHQPHWLSWPPLPTMAFQYRSVSS
jgi:hypothetical protein